MEKFSWWESLRHGGMIISPALMKEYFSDGYKSPSRSSYNYLRDNYLKYEKWWLENAGAYTQLTPMYEWVDHLFESFLQLSSNQWRKSNEISENQTVRTILGERIKPNRLFYKTASDENPSLAIMFDGSKRIGFGKSKKTYGKLLEYLRGQKIKLGIITNGTQFRLCYAGLDFDNWVEWDASNWFADTDNLPQLYGFFTILGKNGFYERDDFNFPLLEAIESSRSRQGELSASIGEQVRQSIEMILNHFSKAKQKYPQQIENLKRNADGSFVSDEVILSAIFQASVRTIMRLVVVLYAEARDLLPRSNEVYHNNYGIEGLFEQLNKAVKSESSEYMEESTNGWIRIQSLFRIIYLGSPHPYLQIRQYGGQLFEPGDSNSSDPIKRVLAFYESSFFEVSNNTVLKVIAKLKYGIIKIKQGRAFTFVKGPVDFSQLRTEYIGMIYEGILDYELKSAKEPMLLINAGLQPILPLSILETLSTQQIKDLFEKLKKGDASQEVEETDSNEQESSEENDDEQQEEEIADNIYEDAIEENIDLENETLLRAMEFAKKAVVVLGWVKKPKNNDEDYNYQIQLNSKAKNLIKEIYNTGDYYISKWGGTRKGTGTFYTRPQLSVPTVRRTLEPLCYTNQSEPTYVVSDVIDKDSVKEPASQYSVNTLQPKYPEEILSLKVCDPACGSGSFLVAALNYLTNALYHSLVIHAELLDQQKAKRKTLPLGLISDNPNDDNSLPCFPDDDDFELKVKTRLKRYIVENCIYGVDLNSTAVELARLSMWIETMDRNLPFEFLDHKIKCGNSLVGAWLDTYQEYPLAAWLREGGDKNHNTSVHFPKEAWTKAIKERFDDVVKPEMVEVINARSGQLNLGFFEDLGNPIEDHKILEQKYNELHKPDLSIFGLENKVNLYSELMNSEAYKKTKERMDLWCSIWFWTGDRIELCPTPKSFYKPDEGTLSVVKQISEQNKFFHWEVEYPDVFNSFREGFDAVIGNPPWEISKPNSKEFFSNLDPIYRTYGKQEALNHQKRLFTGNASIEYNWLTYYSFFKAMGNYVKYVSIPFGDPNSSEEFKISLLKGRSNKTIHRSWAEKRKVHSCYADVNHPYLHQGSADLNTYKMFLEYSYSISKDHGRIGMIVPSGIYSDKGTQGLRNLFINKSKWEWLYSFENKNKIFDIHRSFKFNPIIIEKGGYTDFINTSFMQLEISSWDDAKNIVQFKKEQILKFSPRNEAFLEIRSSIELQILERLFSKADLFYSINDKVYSAEYQREFDTTNDSKLFPPLPVWERNGFQSNEYGTWTNSLNEIAIPLYEGRMISQYDFSKRGWVSGKGRTAKWIFIDQPKRILPQYLMKLEDFITYRNSSKLKLTYKAIASATNNRTFIGCLVSRCACLHVVPTLQIKGDNKLIFVLTAILNSFCFDFVLRRIVSGIYINWSMLEETPLPKYDKIIPLINDLKLLVMKLNFNAINWAPEWFSSMKVLKHINWKSLWAVTNHERIRLQSIIDAIIAELYGLGYEDFAWILKDDPSDPKGFWRIDKDKPKEFRQTTLTLQAFKRLKEIGLDEFVKEDWQFPKDVQLALGPRFLDWQLEGTPEESWKECEYHAKQILGEEGFIKFMQELENIKEDSKIVVKEQKAKYSSQSQADLFK